ncbi:MAG TPA: VWA domain-containing protein [Vicinamibacterales bacterium]|nr:VWA domain-containing protein [Vicinamibacterales bacterium]
MNATLRRLVAAMYVLATPAILGAQKPPNTERAAYTFRSSADLVAIQATVRDSRGRLVNGLTADDFDVRDNGQARPVLSFRSDRHSPVSVAVLIDTSGSMRLGANVAMARQAYEVLLSQLQDGRDEMALFMFDSNVQTVHDFTKRLGPLRGALPQWRPYGTTSLYDATAATARHLAARSSSHKAVIVLTDGIDTSSKLTAAQVSGLASSIDVPVFVISTATSIDRRYLMERAGTELGSQTADLRDLADWTGGQLLFAGTFAETAAAALKLIGDLRQQYVLAIEANNAHGWRRLEISVKGRRAIVRARNGYFGG